jgi:DNA-binding Lrp family transcriptional regulator
MDAATQRGGPLRMDGKSMTCLTSNSLDATDRAILAILQSDGRLGVTEITGVRRVTGEDCFVIDVHAADAGRLEAVVDSIARFGLVTTSLVLRSYETKALTPAQRGPGR